VGGLTVVVVVVAVEELEKDRDSFYAS